MKIRNILPAAGFLILAAAALTGLVRTRGAAPSPSPRGPALREEALVDMTPIATARRLAALASTPEERAFAHDAERLADHEVDLAFADALRRAATATPPSTPEVRALLARKAVQDDAVEDGQRNIVKLGKALAAAREDARDDLEDQLEVAKAQLELDKDELDATGEQLEKLGADPGAAIHRLWAAFNASSTQPVSEGEAPGRFQPGSLLHRLSLWTALHRKAEQLAQAGAQARAAQEHLAQCQQALAADVDQEKEDRESARQQAKGFAHGAAGASQAAGTSRETARATLLTLKHFTEDQRTLADLGKRFQDEREQEGVYRSWEGWVRVQERAALHQVILGASWILLVMILVYFADRIFEGIFRSLLAGRKRVGRNLKVVKFSAWVVGALAIVLIVLGTPGQLTTLFGLAGAGLTVALKDFIISFFGWFILVGPKGIHVGDWVEIRGVSGEVVEIGLLRTLLLETGNWSDAGHPTGRVVSFVNSFALEGHFFNFSSAGQWMWDELTVTAPPGKDPYPFMEAIKGLVEDRTRENTAQAFKEWEHSERGHQVRSPRAEPGINVVPTATGVDIRVRYITRAQDRNELRRFLNESVVDLLHGRHEG